MKAKIQVERNYMLFRYGCFFCNGMIEKEEVRVKVHLTENNLVHKVPPDKNPLIGLLNPDKESFHVCWDCAKGGAVEMKNALVRQAKRLREEAEKAEYTATHLQIECPSWKQIQRKAEKISEKMDAEYKAEDPKEYEELEKMNEALGLKSAWELV